MITNETKYMRKSATARTSAHHLCIRMLGVMFCLNTASALAEGNCSPEKNARAISLLVDARGNWPSLRDHQKEFVACDDGELGEGYSDAVVKLLSRNWDQFGQFVDIARDDVAFQKWVVKHIDASASGADLRMIVRNTSGCGHEQGAEKICNIIGKSAEDALAEPGQRR